jgi:hypothetical protein
MEIYHKYFVINLSKVKTIKVGDDKKISQIEPFTLT